MKNILRTSFIFMISAIILVGCTTSEEKPLVDGTYTVIFDEPDPTNWKAFMTLQVSQGSITDVYYDYEGTGVNEEKLKSEDAAYNEAMFAIAGTKPTIYLEELESALLESQDPDKVDTVTGATTSSRDFRTFVDAALKAAQEGNEETIIIEQLE